MAVTLDSVLNIAIPVAVIVIFAALFYSKIPEPFNLIGRWIKNLFSSVGDVAGGTEYKSVYRYD